MSSNNTPHVVFGSMTFAKQVSSEADACAILDKFLELVQQSGYDKAIELDTALMYPARDSEGLTEQMLCSMMRAVPKYLKLRVATKANPWFARNLSAAGVREQLETSLRNLGVDKVDMFYLHAPDNENAIEPTIRAVAAMHGEGKFERFALSNYTAWQVAEIWMMCEHNGWPKPAVYQGLYNVLSRDVESELIACLRHFGMSFYAYNVTAGGLLTGKHVGKDSVPDTGRFTAAHYRARFWKDDFFAAIDLIRDACKAADVPMADAAHRWMVHHSKLQAGDAIIIGASRLAHIESNTAACLAGPLPQTVLEAMEKANQLAAPTSPVYWGSH